MVRRLIYILLVSVLAISCVSGSAEGKDPVFCNPIDLDYGWGVFKADAPLCRTSADPVIVLFKDRYYLFSTHDIGGYRVSDDLVHWEDRYFNPEVREAALNGNTYVAPAAAADDDYLYFFKLNRDRQQSTVQIIRTSDPDHGRWEVCGEIRRVADPTLFIDKGRYFVFHGLGNGIRRFELDPVTMMEIEGSEALVIPKPKSLDECDGGYNFGRREIFDEIEAPQWYGRHKMLPCHEGPWVFRHGDKCYLQYATPGTISIWYCDAAKVSDCADGDFEDVPFNPVSLKAGGFIGGAGHSSVFEDRYGNWWEITTMWVGSSNEFERRLGLFPVSFDGERMRVHTMLGDYPMSVPQRKFDPDAEPCLKGWWCLSYGKECTASSCDEGYMASMAADENVRTWWSARRDDKSPWLEMDLGSVRTVSAIQLNYAECDITPATFEEDYTVCSVRYSRDGRHFRTLHKGNGRSHKSNPHDFLALKKPVSARYIRVECTHPMNGGPFAIRDLRVFGPPEGPAPSPVTDISAQRDAVDPRYARVTWQPCADADGYLVMFGDREDALDHVIQVKGSDSDSLLVHVLTSGVEYFFDVKAYNSNGISE